MKFTDNKEIWISEDGLLNIFKRYNDIDKLNMMIYTKC